LKFEANCKEYKMSLASLRQTGALVMRNQLLLFVQPVLQCSKKYFITSYIINENHTESRAQIMPTSNPLKKSVMPPAKYRKKWSTG
jgi:hypothetical protein